MRYQTRMRTVLAAALAAAAVAGVGHAARAQAPAPAEAKPSTEEKAVRAVDDAFVAAYEKGDAKALAAMFTEDAEVVEADGARYEGRDLIERSFAEVFAASKGSKIAFEVASLKFLTPDAAKEEGRSIVTLPAGAPEIRFYTVLYVKKGGRWLMASVREEADPVVPPRERLKDLEWMVGDWLDEGSERLVKVTCRWSEDKNFLLRDMRVERQGRPVMNVHQRVAWDAVAREFRSFDFDSEGGFGEGRWARDGDRWVVKETGVRPDGSTASSTRITVRLKADQVQWTLLDRVINGEAVPGEESSLLTRVPPPAEPNAAADASSPKTERSPR